MKKENFKLLLTDLYNVYNQSNVLYVDDLVEKYSRMEIDSVKNIFLKYNRKGTPYYDPKKSSDEYILNLVKQYTNGERPFQNVTLDNLSEEVNKGKETQESTKTQAIKEAITKDLQDDVDNIKNNIKNDLEKQFKTITSLVSDKVQQFKVLEEKINEKAKSLEKQVSEKLAPSEDDNFIIQIVTNFKGPKPILPDDKTLLKLGVKSRIICRDEEDKIVSFIISDISCDTISDEKSIIEIWIDRESQ